MPIVPRRRALLAQALAGLLSPLPADVVGMVKGQLTPVGRLDYADRRISMTVGSPWQVYRLGSSAKEPETIRWLETELQPGDCLYDIGANVGAYSLVAHAIGGGAVTVVAFEPAFATFAELCTNIRLNAAGHRIVPMPLGLGDDNAMVELEYSDVVAGAAQHHWRSRGSDDGTARTFSLQAPLVRLDDVVPLFGLPPPTLIKLDVDGLEVEVLRGGRGLLASPELRSCLVELDLASPSTVEAVALLEHAGLVERSRHVRGGEGSLHNLIFERRH